MIFKKSPRILKVARGWKSRPEPDLYHKGQVREPGGREKKCTVNGGMTKANSARDTTPSRVKSERAK